MCDIYLIYRNTINTSLEMCLKLRWCYWLYINPEIYFKFRLVTARNLGDIKKSIFVNESPSFKKIIYTRVNKA